LTRYNLNRPVRLLTAEEAGRAIDQVERARQRGLRERGRGWCYVGDEMFLIAGRELPQPDYYDDAALLENGVGAVRHFLDDLDSGLPALPRLPGRRVRIMTGSSMGPFLSERAEALASATGAEVSVEVVRNEFYGEVVTTAGLMAGRDLLAHLQGTVEARDLVLVPAEALNGDELFIDSLPLSELRAALAPARVEAGHEMTELLRRAGAAEAA
jgi:NifB/MoaA-like Fe-S oxidoreductase